MAFALVSSANVSDGDSIVHNATAGSLIVAWLGWENSTSTTGLTSFVGNIEGALTLLPASGNGNTCHQQFAYKMVATGGATNTYTPTYPSGAVFKNILVYEFSYSTANGPIALDVGDDEGTNTGNGTALTSGSVTLATTGESEIAFAGGNSYTAPSTFSALQINSVAADGSLVQSVDSRVVLMYRIVTSAFTGTATATCNNSDDWGCHIIAFKEASAGGAVITEQEGFRFRNDDGSESSATWKQDQDVNATVAVDQNFRLRFLINKR
jgi:hypothetical protein